MKKLLLPVLLFAFVSCSNPVEKKYEVATYAADIKAMEGEITSEDKALLNDWVLKHSVNGKDIQLNGLTYQQILDDAKKDQKEKARKLKKFYDTKFTTGEKFAEDTQRVMDEGIFSPKEEDVSCIGFFCGYKGKEGTITNYTYYQIFKEAPSFCKEKGYPEQ